jgi:hypothetical protein
MPRRLRSFTMDLTPSGRSKFRKNKKLFTLVLHNVSYNFDQGCSLLISSHARLPTCNQIPEHKFFAFKEGLAFLRRPMLVEVIVRLGLIILVERIRGFIRR